MTTTFRHSLSCRSRQDLLVRIQVMAPVWSDHFPGRWEDVSEDGIRLGMPEPVAPGSVIAVRTRSLVIWARVQRCHNLGRDGYSAEAAVIRVYAQREASAVSRQTAGLVRLWLALEKLRAEETNYIVREAAAGSPGRPRRQSFASSAKG
jgi:hypothetical protein